MHIATNAKLPPSATQFMQIVAVNTLMF